MLETLPVSSWFLAPDEVFSKAMEQFKKHKNAAIGFDPQTDTWTVYVNENTIFKNRILDSQKKL